jgi:hypothetical protein
MSLAVLTCRETGHYFPLGKGTRERIREAVRLRGHLHAEVRDLVQVTRRCECCTSERVDVYDRSTLELVRRHYRLIEGYAAEPGTGRVERVDARRELLERLT